ncbi:MAG TPA: hypothetical protein PK522_00735 [Nitrosomonas sp.]|nr:hypothetical protein [Nitrosomonas sp.]
MLCDFSNLESDSRFELIRDGYLFALSRHKKEVLIYSLRMNWICDLLEKSKIGKENAKKIYTKSYDYLIKNDYNRFIKYFAFQICSLASDLCDEFNCKEKMDDDFKKFESLIVVYSEDIEEIKAYIGG